MATESAYFRQQKARNPNTLINGNAEWQPDAKIEAKRVAAFERVSHDLNSGIIQKLRLQREQEMNKIVATQCYKNPELSFPQANKCADWVRSKDFKTTLLKTFAADHLVQHHLAYQTECIDSEQMRSLKTIEEKDRSYVTCHN
mgnify:FL=1